MLSHLISACTAEEMCLLCFNRDGQITPATHKVGEEIPSEEMADARDAFLSHAAASPAEAAAFPQMLVTRHNLTAYVCCACFGLILGSFAVDICSQPPDDRRDPELVLQAQERIKKSIAERFGAEQENAHASQDRRTDSAAAADHLTGRAD